MRSASLSPRACAWRAAGHCKRLSPVWDALRGLDREVDALIVVVDEWDDDRVVEYWNKVLAELNFNYNFIKLTYFFVRKILLN